MLRNSLALVAVALAAGVVGCTTCDTCDDFPTPCVGANCGYAGRAQGEYTGVPTSTALPVGAPSVPADLIPPPPPGAPASPVGNPVTPAAIAVPAAPAAGNSVPLTTTPPAPTSLGNPARSIR
jgi:hypothetical protein